MKEGDLPAVRYTQPAEVLRRRNATDLHLGEQTIKKGRPLSPKQLGNRSGDDILALDVADQLLSFHESNL